MKESAITAKANNGKKTTKESSKAHVRDDRAFVTPCSRTDQLSGSPVHEPTPQSDSPKPLARARVPEVHRDERSANSNLLPSFEDDNEDSGLWELVCSTKPTGKRKVLFLGNLPSDTTTEKLSQFVTTRASSAETQVKIHECKIFLQEARSSARLVLNSKTAALVNSIGFWPRPVTYSRQWNFEKYQHLSDKQSLDDQHMSATDQEPVIDMDAPSQIPPPPPLHPLPGSN